MSININRTKPLWAIPPKHPLEVVATERGWVVKETGEVLKSIRNLDTKLQTFGFVPTKGPTPKPAAKKTARKAKKKVAKKSTIKKNTKPKQEKAKKGQ